MDGVHLAALTALFILVASTQIKALYAALLDVLYGYH